ncbi:MAG: hypothetical protein ACT4OP_10360 [Actinomycetota bacterium]
MTWDPEQFDDLAEDLRRRVGHEIRQEAAEVERLTDLMRRRREKMADVAIRAMHGGDRVTVRSRAGAWTGMIEAVGEDYLTLRAGHQVIDAQLAGVGLEIAAARLGGRSGRPDSATWKARLAELSETQAQLVVFAPDLGLKVSGIITLVGANHLEVSLPSGDRPVSTYLPLRSVTLVVQGVPA